MSDAEPQTSGRRPVGIAVVVVAAWVAMLGFRVGVLPGGLVGVDVALAAAGWWFASGGPGFEPFRQRVALGWTVLWRPVLVALALAIVWVLVRDATTRDVLVRGQALGVLGGYLNWHQLSVGPVEASGSRLDAPLQHLWALAVLAQCLVAWSIVVAATRGRAARHPDQTDPAAALGLALGLFGAAIGAALAFGGASGQAVLLASPVRAVPFLLGAAAAAGSASTLGRDLGVLASRIWPLVGGLLVLVAVAAAPDSAVGRWSSALVAPLLAVLLVIGVGTLATRAAALPDVVPAWPWSALVASWVLATPCLAVARVAVGGSTAIWVAAGLVLAAVVVGSVVWVETMASTMPAAIERRRTLAPPAAVLLVVLLLSVTGAFHWQSTETREDWERTHQP